MRSLDQSGDVSGGAIFVTDDAGTVLWASAEANCLVGAGPEGLAGRKASEFLSPPSSFPSKSVAGNASAQGWTQWERRDQGLVEIASASTLLPSRPEVWIVRWVNPKAADGPFASSGDSTAKSPLEAGSDGAFRLSEDGRWTEVNNPFAEICGYRSPEEFLAAFSDDASLLFVERARHGEFMQGLRERGAVTHFESAIYRHDRTTTWISQSAHAVRDREGRVRHYVGTIQDIGWRKLAEEILNQADERWRAVVESSGECIVIVDRSGAVFFANGKARQAGLGQPGGSVFTEFSAQSQHHLRAGIDLAFRTTQVEALTLEHCAAGALRVWYEVRVVPIGHVDSAERAILIATDLTGKRRAEEAIREGQRLIGRVADASPAILYVYEFASERCVYVNHQVERILGYATDSFLEGEQSLAGNLVHPDDASVLGERRRLLSEARDDGVVFEYTMRMRHADGQWRWIRARDVVFTRDPQGRPVQIIGMAEDVTERRRAVQERERSREQLRALSARLQEAREEERAAISRRVHDELGQALTALSWELTKLSDQLGSTGMPATIGERLTDMGGMVDAMMQIVRKVAAELRPPILDHFGLVAAIEWQAQEFQDRYQIQCEVAAHTRRSHPDRTISTAIFRIFQEVLTNIARHAGASKVRVQFNDTPTGFALVVQDNGRGITEGEKSRSLGILGMSERAHLLGGTIKIDGATGRGTTVTVHIPDAAAAGDEAPRQETLRASN
jgi:PAS domain S-box-containing protein